jgi:predicted extracellular nuclease
VFKSVVAVLLSVSAAPVLAQTTCVETHRIHDLQGNATQTAGGVHNDVSPRNGQLVTLEGTVVADYQSIPQSPRFGELRGFFVEEELADHDADPSTSEGLFVFTGSGGNGLSAKRAELRSGAGSRRAICPRSRACNWRSEAKPALAVG